MRAADKLGAKRAGMLCAPAGKLTWRDVSPDPDRAAEAVARALRGHGADVRVPDPAVLDEGEAPTSYRIIGTVVALTMKACAPAWGAGRWIDHSHRLKAEGRIAIRWRIYDTNTRALVATREVIRDFKLDSPDMDGPHAVERAVAEAAPDLAGIAAP